MKIDLALINRLEELARLDLSVEEKTRLIKDLSNILDMVDKLEELDTDEVDPLVYISKSVNVMREDVIQNQVDRTAALKNAPDKTSEYFKVPKVIDI